MAYLLSASNQEVNTFIPVVMFSFYISEPSDVSSCNISGLYTQVFYCLPFTPLMTVNRTPDLPYTKE
jgi:hypothetical protein